MRLLEHEAANVVTPALRTVGNLVTGDDLQTQQVLDARPDEGQQRPTAPEAAARRLAFAHCLLSGDGIPEQSPLQFLDALDDVVRRCHILGLYNSTTMFHGIHFSCYSHV